MTDDKYVHFKNRDEWRTWLEKNRATEKRVWIVTYKKHTGKTGVTYNDAVEEALCFGWIDSTAQRMDKDKFAIKITPRKPNSVWAKSNTERAEKMIREGKMTPAGAALIEEAKKRGQWQTAYRLRDKQDMPPDLQEALSRNKEALRNFNNFAQGYRNQYIYWINFAKQSDTRKKRIAKVVKKAMENKKPGEE